MPKAKNRRLGQIVSHIAFLNKICYNMINIFRLYFGDRMNNMTIEDGIIITKFEELFGGFVFREEPGTRWIYDKDGRTYSVPENFLSIIRKSIEDEVDHLVSVGTEIEHDPDVLY